MLRSILNYFGVQLYDAGLTQGHFQINKCQSVTNIVSNEINILMILQGVYCIFLKGKKDHQ